MRTAYRPLPGNLLHPFPLHRQPQLPQPLHHRPPPLQPAQPKAAQDVLKLPILILQIIAQDMYLLRRRFGIRAQLNRRNQLQAGMTCHRPIRLGQTLRSVVVRYGCHP